MAGLRAAGTRNLGRTGQAREDTLHAAEHVLEGAHRVVKRFDGRSDELHD